MSLIDWPNSNHDTCACYMQVGHHIMQMCLNETAHKWVVVETGPRGSTNSSFKLTCHEVGPSANRDLRAVHNISFKWDSPMNGPDHGLTATRPKSMMPCITRGSRESSWSEF